MSKQLPKLCCALIGLFLSGCGIADHYTAQSRMEKSEDSYRTCVVANPTNEDKCATLKAIYEEDKATYEK